MKKTLGIHDQKRKVRHAKQKLFKKKLKSKIAAMNCKHARVKQEASNRKAQVTKLVDAVKKIVAAKKQGEKAAAKAVAASETARVAAIASLKAQHRQEIENLKATHLAELNAAKSKGKIAESKITEVKAQAAKAVSVV